MLKNSNVLGYTLMNSYIKISTISAIRIYFNKHVPQKRYYHIQSQGNDI